MTTPQLRNSSVYATTARFDDDQRFLTDKEIRELAPSVFSCVAHNSRSEHFKAIPTIDVIRALRKEGFGVVGALQSRSINDDRKNYTKHLLRLRKMDEDARYKVNDTVFEILLKNANDGTSCYDMLAGLWRILCLNSLVAMNTEVSSCRVRHSGDVIPRVIDATFEIVKDSKRALEAPDKWSRIQLSPDEEMIFARSAHEIRFPRNDDGSDSTHVVPEQLLKARRTEDTKHDLWTTFNRVQENSVKGGLVAEAMSGTGRKARTRTIKSIDQSTALNRALWTLAEEMAKLKN